MPRRGISIAWQSVGRAGKENRRAVRKDNVVSQQAHYFKIGLFVVAATALAVIGIIVLGAGKWLEKSAMVETYFFESVQGLEIGAPVRLRGVRVGRVESIRLAREEYGVFFDPKTDSFPYRGLVVVRMSVRPSVAAHLKEEDEAVMMKQAVDAGFRFRLASQGITGVLYIESEFLNPERYPPILFLDEPSAGLDPITSAELDQLIISLSRHLKITFVVVTHELPSIDTIADRVIMLDKRTQGIIAEGRPQELRDHSDNPWVRQFFNRQVEAAG